MTLSVNNEPSSSPDKNPEELRAAAAIMAAAALCMPGIGEI